MCRGLPCPYLHLPLPLPPHLPLPRPSLTPLQARAVERVEAAPASPTDAGAQAGSDEDWSPSHGKPRRVLALGKKTKGNSSPNDSSVDVDDLLGDSPSTSEDEDEETSVIRKKKEEIEKRRKEREDKKAKEEEREKKRAQVRSIGRTFFLIFKAVFLNSFCLFPTPRSGRTSRGWATPRRSSGTGARWTARRRRGSGEATRVSHAWSPVDINSCLA